MRVSESVPGPRITVAALFKLVQVAGLTAILVLGFMTAAKCQALHAQSAVVVDASGRVLAGKASGVPRPIASITKVMTAAVVAEVLGGDEAALVTIRRAEAGRRLRAGDRVAVGDLLRLMLVASDNGAAAALARKAAGTATAFVALMNAKAKGLGLPSTRFADPAGLSASNRSTAVDVAKMLRSVAAEPRLAGLLALPGWSFKAGRRTVAATNTNRLLRDPGLEVTAGKTGTTRKAGFCLATMISTPDGDLAVVVLGARTSAGRFSDARTLYDAARNGG